MGSSLPPAAAGSPSDPCAELRERYEGRSAELSALLGRASVGIAFVDRSLMVVRANETLLDWLGRRSHEIQLEQKLDQLLPGFASALVPPITRVFANGQASFDHDLACDSGQLAHARVAYLPVLTPEGRVGRVALVIQNLGELRRVELELVQRVDFETLVTHASEQLIRTPHGQGAAAVRAALDELCRFYGFSRVALVRIAAGTVLELAHHSPGFADQPRLLAELSQDEVRRLRPLHRLVREQGASALHLLESGPRPAAPPAYAVVIPRSVEHALVCYPVRASLPDRLVAELQSFARLVLARLSSDRTTRDERAREGETRAPARCPPTSRAPSFISSSNELREILASLDAVAPTRTTVLIQGESGVGKELVARTLHDRSPRAASPLVTVNCASIPRELFESEFFGHTRGAFTGAHRDRAGRFEVADGGTLFLDEVAEIPLELQAKLLRVLQESEFERVGDHRTRRVDVRVVAATNRNLTALVKQGSFREDLYYRLGVFPIHVPPLRARPDDILALARHFLELQAAELGRQELTLTAEDERSLLRYDWPGNVRELHNVIARAVIRSPRPPLRLDLALQRDAAAEPPPAEPPRAFLTASEFRERERANIVAALVKSGWRVSGRGGAAELLGIRPSTLRDRLYALGIRRPSGVPGQRRAPSVRSRSARASRWFGGTLTVAYASHQVQFEINAAAEQVPREGATLANTRPGLALRRQHCAQASGKLCAHGALTDPRVGGVLHRQPPQLRLVAGRVQHEARLARALPAGQLEQLLAGYRRQIEIEQHDGRPRAPHQVRNAHRRGSRDDLETFKTQRSLDQLEL